MAFTVSIEKSVFGNKRANILTVTADSAEATIDTGLNVVDGFSIGVISMATFAYSMKPNVGSTGTALVGKIGVSGVASGDTFYLVCLGK